MAGMGGIGGGRNLIKLAGISPDSGEMTCKKLQWILKFQPANDRKGI
jgi:hypothetical protein